MTEIRIQILRAPKARAEVFEGVHTWPEEAPNYVPIRLKKHERLIAASCPLTVERFRRAFRSKGIRSLRAPKARAEGLENFTS